MMAWLDYKLRARFYFELLAAALPTAPAFACQDCSAYANEPLRTVGLLEAAHQYSVQDMHGSARTPAPAPLLIQK